MTVSIKNALDLIADGKYLQAEEQLKQLVALFPEEKELYNLYAYCEDCMEDICEDKSLDLADAAAQPPKEKPKWEEFHQDIQKFADQGEYKKSIVLLGLLWDSPPLDPPSSFLHAGLKARAAMCKERAICHFLQGDLEDAKTQYIHSLGIELSAYAPDDLERVPLLTKKKDYAESI